MELWSVALGLGSTVKDMASNVAVQVQVVRLSERDVFKMAAPPRRMWRKHLHLHVRTDSSTLWHLLDAALQVTHARTVAHRTTMRMQLRRMEGLPTQLHRVGRCFRRAAC